MVKGSQIFGFIITLFFSTILCAETNENNQQIISHFYDLLINQKNFIAASAYLSPNFIQHNPLVGDGPEGLEAYVNFLLNNYPNAHSKIKKIFADGNYVIVHVHSIREPGTRGRAIFDLFRLEDGKIVEHWDTIQEIPENSRNGHGMF